MAAKKATKKKVKKAVKKAVTKSAPSFTPHLAWRVPLESFRDSATLVTTNLLAHMQTAFDDKLVTQDLLHQLQATLEATATVGKALKVCTDALKAMHDEGKGEFEVEPGMWTLAFPLSEKCSPSWKSIAETLAMRVAVLNEDTFDRAAWEEAEKKKKGKSKSWSPKITADGS